MFRSAIRSYLNPKIFLAFLLFLSTSQADENTPFDGNFLLLPMIVIVLKPAFDTVHLELEPGKTIPPVDTLIPLIKNPQYLKQLQPEQIKYAQEPMLIFMINAFGPAADDNNDNSDSNSYVCAITNGNLDDIEMTTNGSPEPDPDPPASQTAIDLDDDPDEIKFNLLKKKIEAVRFYNTCGRLKLVHQMLTFLNKHPEFAEEGYPMALKLLKYESATISLFMAFGVSFTVGFSAFDDKALAFVRSLLTVTHVMLANIAPWMLSDKWWMDQIAVWLGIIGRSFGDNGFAIESNSTYAMDWNSKEFSQYVSRVTLSQWFNILMLKHVYGGLIIPKLASQSSINKNVMFAVDFPLRFVLFFLGGAGQLAGYPYISLTAGANPYGPAGEFPWPYYCPKIQWVPWFIGCTPVDEIDEELPDDEQANNGTMQEME